MMIKVSLLLSAPIVKHVYKKVILLNSTLTLGDVVAGNHLFVIFAVLEVSFAINSCRNRSFFTFICA